MEQRDQRADVVKCRGVSPKKTPGTAHDIGSREDLIPPTHRQTPNTSHFSPHKYPKTQQNEESSEKGSSSQVESQKRKGHSPCKGSPEKKRCTSGYFVDSMICQWAKHVGIQPPPLQTEQQGNVLVDEEVQQICALKDIKIQKLMNKLFTAEETISSLTGRLQAQQAASTEVLKELNNDGESISNYCRELAEGLKGFQEHKDNLSAMYNVILINQRDAVEKLQNELRTVKVNVEEYEKNISTMKNQVMEKERRIKELEFTEGKLKQQLQNIEEKSMMERNQLLVDHAAEVSELTKKWENLTSANQELKIQLQKIAEEKDKLVENVQLIEKKYNYVQSNYVSLENKFMEVQSANLNLEKSLKDVQHNDEEKISELNRQIRILQMEKEQLNLEKSSNAEEIENYYKSREEKYKAEINKLKGDYDVQIMEMKKIEAENSALIKSREDEYKAEIEKLKEHYDIQLMELKKIGTENSALIKSREDEHKAEIEKLKENYDIQLMGLKKIEAENSALIKSREDEHKAEIEKLKENYGVQLTELKKIQERNSAPIKSREDEHKAEIEKLKKVYDVQVMEMMKIEAENSALIKSREVEHKAEIEKLKENYNIQLMEVKKIQERNSALIKSREDEHKAEIEKLKKDYEAKLIEIKQQNKIAQGKGTFDKLEKYLQEREEKKKLENVQIKQATGEITDLEKYLIERDENVFIKEKEVLEKQRDNVKETTGDRKYDDKQKDKVFKIVKKYQKSKIIDRSEQDKKELDKLPKNVNENEENENVAKTRKDFKEVNISITKTKFDDLLKNRNEKDRDELTKDSSVKIQKTIRKRPKLVPSEKVKEMGNQMRLDQLSQNLFLDVGEEMSSQQLEDEYDFTIEVEQPHFFSSTQRELESLKRNTSSQFADRIEKIRGKFENTNATTPKRIFTTGLKQFSGPKSQPRKWERF